MREFFRVLVFVVATFVAIPAAFAHCDSLNGPVIAEARLAFKQGQVTPVLKWVRQADEAVVREAFSQALAVRSKGDEARELAERYFFETLIRLHRASEGAPYTGLKVENTDKVIAAVDSALQSNSGERLIDETLQHVRAELKKRLDLATATRKSADSSVESGRKYVHAYVDLMHFVERLHDPIAADEPEAATAHQH
jgi:uncharacterized protein DUF6448